MDVFALSGYSPDDPDDEYVLIAGAVLDQPLLKGPVAKSRREDIQVLDYLRALALNGSSHPLDVYAGEDPPDRYVEASGERWAVELTELTLEDVRGDLARMRRFGRDVETALAASTRHAHLQGKVVQLSIVPQAGNPPPGDTNELIAELLAVLADDKGFVGEGADYRGAYLRSCRTAASTETWVQSPCVLAATASPGPSSWHRLPRRNCIKARR